MRNFSVFDGAHLIPLPEFSAKISCTAKSGFFSDFGHRVFGGPQQFGSTI